MPIRVAARCCLPLVEFLLSLDPHLDQVVDVFYVTDREGEKVIVELGVPIPGVTAPEGTVVEVLGPPDAPGVDTESIVLQYGLPRDFPTEVEAEAARLAGEISPADLEGRRDLRGELTVTIDPADAQDYDDAVSLRKNADGTLTAGVHIADVSHYVGAGGAIDKEALSRATSIYLPGEVIPMIPQRLSNDLCSLRPQCDLLTKTFTRLFPDH